MKRNIANAADPTECLLACLTDVTTGPSNFAPLTT